MERFIEGQQFDIFQTRQQRLIIETPEGLPVGALDLFDLDPVNLRAGVGILIHDTAQRGKGYAADAVETVCSYARDMLHLHQLWCSVEAGNAASLALFRNAGFSETGVRKEWLRVPAAPQNKSAADKHQQLRKMLRSQSPAADVPNTHFLNRRDRHYPARRDSVHPDRIPDGIT